MQSKSEHTTSLESFRAHLTAKCGLSGANAGRYVACLERVQLWLAGRHALATIPISEVRQYARDMRRCGIKSQAVVRAVNCIRSYLTFAGRTDGADLLTGSAEVRAQIGAAKSLRDRAVIALLYGSDLRESELCALRIGDIEDWFEGRIKTSGGSAFTDTLALAHVWTYLDSRPQPLAMTDWVFPDSSDPRRPLSVGHVLSISPHATRAVEDSLNHPLAWMFRAGPGEIHLCA